MKTKTISAREMAAKKKWAKPEMKGLTVNSGPGISSDGGALGTFGSAP